MVAYSFKKRFIDRIEDNTKRQTIRAPRAGRGRHARPGEELQLYTAMRTKQCRLLGRSICEIVTPIEIRLNNNTIMVNLDPDLVASRWVRYGGHLGRDIDEFARADGFDSWEDMKAFWREEHGAIERFDGVLIKWGDLLKGD